MRVYLLERLNKLQSEFETLLSARSEQLEQLVRLESNYQQILSMKDEVSNLQRQNDDIKYVSALVHRFSVHPVSSSVCSDL